MNRVFFSIGSFNIYWYSILILFGVFIGIFLANKETERIKIGKSFVIDLFFGVIIWGIIGARIYYVIFKFADYKNNILDIFKIWEGGLAIYGAIIAGIIYIFSFCRKRDVSFFKTTDVLCVSLILAQAIGRWGNFLNGEAYGNATTLEFLQKLHLPSFIIEGMHINGVYYQPTFLYESLWCLIGFIILIIIRYAMHGSKIGTQTSIYFIWYGIGRFFIESIRTDSLYFGNFRISQIVSIVLVLMGVITLLLTRRNDKYHIKESNDVRL